MRKEWNYDAKTPASGLYEERNYGAISRSGIQHHVKAKYFIGIVELNRGASEGGTAPAAAERFPNVGRLAELHHNSQHREFKGKRLQIWSFDQGQPAWVID